MLSHTPANLMLRRVNAPAASLATALAAGPALSSTSSSASVSVSSSSGCSPAVFCSLRHFTGGPFANGGSQQERPSSTTTATSRSGSNPGDGFSRFVKKTLETAATATTESASAFFKPQGVSPLASLRPPSPPTAADARPFGYLNRGNRIPTYRNVNAVPPALHRKRKDEKADGRKSSSECSDGDSAAAAVASASPMKLDKLLRTHTRVSASTTRRSAGDSAAADSTTTTTSSTTGTAATSASPAATTTTTSSVSVSTASASSSPIVAGHATVERAQATIAAAERQKQRTAAAAASMSHPTRDNGDAARQDKAHATAGKTAHAKGRARQSHDNPPPPPNDASSSDSHHQQLYREHCTIGWSPSEFYNVVADVSRYPAFLPWCLEAQVHSTKRVQVRASEVKRRSPHYYQTVVVPLMAQAQRNRRSSRRDGDEETEPPTSSSSSTSTSTATATAASQREALSGGDSDTFMVDAIEMRATLWVGFSFFKEHYTSCVTLLPGAHITAALADEPESAAAAAAARSEEGLLASLFRKAANTTGVSAVKKSILKSLLCEWDFVPVENNRNAVEVSFAVSFEFKNPMHATMIMNNIVALMTRSFERQCERLYGPPSAEKQALPLPIL